MIHCSTKRGENVEVQLLLFNRQEELVDVLENGTAADDEPEQDGSFYFIEAKWVRELNGEESLTVTLPADHPGADHVVNGHKFGFFDQQGHFQLFEIGDTGEVHEDEQEKEVFCQHVFTELKESPRISDIRPQHATAEYALSRALENTNWQVGDVSELGERSTNFYRESPLSAIRKIIETWEAEVRWRVETDGRQITGRYVDLFFRRGSENGHAFIYGENVESIERTIDDEEVKTALYGYGKGEETEGGGHGRRISIADVVWNQDNGDPLDKPAGQEWLGDPEAKERHGRWQNGGWVHRFGDFEDSEEEDPEELIKSMYVALNKAKEPIVNYKVKAVDLEEATDEYGEPMDHVETDMGDTCYAINHDFHPAMTATVRAIKDTQYLSEPERRLFELGNFLPLFNNKRLDDLEKRFNDRVGIIDHPPRQRIEDEDFPEDVPDMPANFSAQGAFKFVNIRWDFVSSSKVAAYELFASRTAGFTPSAENRIWRGRSGGYTHEAGTDEVWYYRLRALNHHEDPSEYTSEVAASTVKIDGGVDIEPYTITELLIAENAQIDFAHIVNVEIGNAHINELSFSRLMGGIATFGGENNGFGIARWLDEDGELVAEMDAEQGGFDNLYAANFRSDQVEAPNVPVYSDESYNLRVRGSAGDDENTGIGDWPNALYSAREAVRRLPQIIDGDITIEFSNQYDVQENIIIGGLTGSGTLTIDLRGNTFRGYIKVASCNIRVIIRGGSIERTGSGVYLIDNESSAYVNITDMVLNGDGQSHGVRTWRNGYSYISSTEVYNVEDCFYGTTGGRMFISAVGLGTEYGIRLINGAVAHAGNNGPMGETGNVSETNSSLVVGSWNHDSGSATPPAPPVTEVTSSFTTSNGASWRSQGPQWRSDYVYQGQWSSWGPYRGLWLFGNQIRSAVMGSNITRIRVRARRHSEGGNYQNSTVVFRPHDYQNQPNNQPSYGSATHSVTFDRGERKWVTLPTSFHTAFENGARGLGVYSTNTSQSRYVIMDSAIEIEITREVEG